MDSHLNQLMLDRMSDERLEAWLENIRSNLGDLVIMESDLVIELNNRQNGESMAQQPETD